MEVGDLVIAHWGNCDYSGEENIDWGFSAAVIVSEVRDDGCIDVLVQGAQKSYHVTRLELIDETR